MRFLLRLLGVALISVSSIATALGDPAGSHLNWGTLDRWERSPPSPAPPELTRVLQVAASSLDTSMEASDSFRLQGTLNTDPAHQAADRVKANFPTILDLAICSRTAQQPLRANCLNKANAVLQSWANTYVPTGNPIDEMYFLPLIQSIDLIAPVLPAKSADALKGWARAFASAGDRYYSAISTNNSARFNNWMAARLVLRGAIAAVCADSDLKISTRDMLTDFTSRNFVPGSNGQADGATYDFVQRDALHYHVADVLPLVQMLLFTPDQVSPAARELIHKGVTFVKPYYVGDVVHIEFAHTTVAFDNERILKDKNNPDFQNKPWNPASAGAFFLLAQDAFPDIRAWTSTSPNTHSNPDDELIGLIFTAPT